jgi:FlaA1/EpsC-like NDP-sugar epimerase
VEFLKPLKNMSKDKNILIVGAGKAGRLLANDLKSMDGQRLVGFVDDATGTEVIGALRDLGKICKIRQIDEIVIAIPSSDGSLIRKILINIQNNRVPIKIIPREQQIIRTGLVNYNEVRDLIIDDFLGRKYDRSDLSGLQKHFLKKRVLVTGGAGSIGSEIVKQLLQMKTEQVVVYDNCELLTFNLDQYLKENSYPSDYKLIIGNILNRDKLERCIKFYRPEIIIHAAAYKHVYLMQENIDEAIINNIEGTKNVVDTAIRFNVPQLTFISTDKVVNPTSVMGATKRICELYIQKAYTPYTHLKWDIVRFGNVINSNGSVLPLFERQIREQQMVTITHKDVSRFFMSIKEASRLVIESTADEISNSAHVLNMGELVNIFEIAKCLIRSKNLIPGVDVKIHFTGLRKGEKMTEELFTKDEISQLSFNKQANIYAVKLSAGKKELDRKIISLITNSKKGDLAQVSKQLKRMFVSLQLS